MPGRPGDTSARAARNAFWPRTARLPDWPAGFLILILIVLLAVFYVISLRAHPFRGCPACHGTGRHRGAFVTYSHRRCRRCGGGGRQNRRGVQPGVTGGLERLPGRGRGAA
jgi:hypothetical protein